MKQIELDLEYLTNLTTLVSRIKICTKLGGMLSPYGKAVVAGGAIRDMLFNRPVSDIDVFYEGEINDLLFKQYFPNSVVPTVDVYPDGWNLTHNIMHEHFPVKIQLIQVKDIAKHVETFPSPMMRMWFDIEGIHGLDGCVFGDAKAKVFFWDQQVDLSYFKKIKEKYSDWKHEFMEDHFNPEQDNPEVEEESMEF